LWVRPSISAGLDAEDGRDLVGAHLDAASVTVTEMGGQVAKRLGDGLRRYFGYPVAQENDAGAARAALSIQRAFAEINRKNAGSGKPALNAPKAGECRSTSARALANRAIGGSRPRNGWLWTIDPPGHLVLFVQLPLRCVEFGAVPFGWPTIHPPCALPPRAWLQ
jgi:hypothetical protein